MVMKFLRASYPANGPWVITQEDVTLPVFLCNGLRRVQPLCLGGLI